MAKNRRRTIVWCMGQTQHTIGNAIVRASCILQLALGNVGSSGGGANIYRGHDNVQGATDVGPNPIRCPATTASSPAPGRTGPRSGTSTLEWLKKQFAAEAMMNKPGITVSRWIDGVLEKNELIDQDSEPARDDLLGPRAQQPVARQGNGRGDEKARPAGRDRSVSSATAAMAAMVRKDGAYLLPAATQFETAGIVTALQPLAPMAREGDRAAVRGASPTRPSCTCFAKKFGFADQLVGKKDGKQNIKVVKDEPVDRGHILREINRGTWTIGYTGQSPERLKPHMKQHATFDVKTLRARPRRGPYATATISACRGRATARRK